MRVPDIYIYIYLYYINSLSFSIILLNYIMLCHIFPLIIIILLLTFIPSLQFLPPPFLPYPSLSSPPPMRLNSEGSSYYQGPLIDLYRVLEIRRNADSETIKQGDRKKEVIVKEVSHRRLSSFVIVARSPSFVLLISSC